MPVARRKWLRDWLDEPFMGFRSPRAPSLNEVQEAHMGEVGGCHPMGNSGCPIGIRAIAIDSNLS